MHGAIMDQHVANTRRTDADSPPEPHLQILQVHVLRATPQGDHGGGVDGEKQRLGVDLVWGQEVQHQLLLVDVVFARRIELTEQIHPVETGVPLNYLQPRRHVATVWHERHINVMGNLRASRT